MAQEIPEWVAQYVGLPYVPGGRSRAGVDCWGLLTLVWNEQFGVPLPEYEGRRWDRGPIEGLAEDAGRYASQFIEVPPGEERLGDGLLLRLIGHPLHVGLVVAPGKMLHGYIGSDSCVEEYRSWRWAKRIQGFYRYAPT